MTPTINRDTVTLLKGAHGKLEGGCGACYWEIRNFLCGVTHLDGHLTDRRPEDVSPVLYWYSLRLNDRLDDISRQALRKFLPASPGAGDAFSGTAGDGHDQVRLWMLADWTVRTALPAWLGHAGQDGHAATVRALAPITSEETARAARDVVRGLYGDIWEHRQKVYEDLRAQVRKAYLEARKAVATAATTATTADAADAADATADAAGCRTAYDQVYEQVYDAVIARLAPTRDELATSAIGLLEAMIHPAVP